MACASIESYEIAVLFPLGLGMLLEFERAGAGGYTSSGHPTTASERMNLNRFILESTGSEVHSVQCCADCGCTTLDNAEWRLLRQEGAVWLIQQRDVGLQEVKYTSFTMTLY